MDCMGRFLKLLLLVCALVAPLACDYYAKPHRALPESFAVNTLDGGTLRAEAFRGKPWVIAVWLPG